MEITLGRRRIGSKHPVFVIAEAGINHNGSVRIAKKLVDCAKKAGADCVKFQTHITEKEMIKTDMKPGNISKRSLWSIIKECELSADDESELNKYCKKNKIMFLSTPFSIPAVERLEKLGVLGYKIASSEVTNPPFLAHVAKKAKTIILSTGMSEMSEIRRAVSILKRQRVPLALLQTTSEYPADYKDINLGVIERLEKSFKVPVGISDHSIGIYTALGAVAKGACIVEKHITLDKKMPGPDQKISLDPGELAELVKGCRAVKLALGSTKKILPKEVPILRFARECVASTRAIHRGEIFSEENIAAKRPGTGPIPAKHYYKIIGKKARTDIPADKQFSYRDVL